jgi:hypothetical protein
MKSLKQKCRELYEEDGSFSVYYYCHKIHHKRYDLCLQCDANVPVDKDGDCLLCGTTIPLTHNFGVKK